ncbi:MAG: lysophospholipid acyltransferase family protein [Pirellulales bacterium]|nr:lysophospholipid acyltransferase family protein [Pirellulales bacterium]
MLLRTVGDYLVYLTVRILICIVQALPLETGVRLAHGFAWLFCEVLKIRGAVIEENLRHAFPRLSAAARRRLARQMWEHLFLLVLEVAQTPRKIHETNWRQFIALEDEDHLVRLLLEKKPLLVVTGHLGNFEVGGYVLGILGFQTYTIARTLDNPFLDRFVNQFRSRTGQQIIPKNGGYEEIQRVLTQRGVLTFLADQYAGPKGCWIEFFGRPASAHKAIALLALEYQAVLALAVSVRLQGPMRFCLRNYAMFDPAGQGGGENPEVKPSPYTREELANVREITQWFSSRLEDQIRTAPEQYWWLHRRWKDTRLPRRRKKQAA